VVASPGNDLGTETIHADGEKIRGQKGGKEGKWGFDTTEIKKKQKKRVIVVGVPQWAIFPKNLWAVSTRERKTQREGRKEGEDKKGAHDKGPGRNGPVASKKDSRLCRGGESPRGTKYNNRSEHQLGRTKEGILTRVGAGPTIFKGREQKRLPVD